MSLEELEWVLELITRQVQEKKQISDSFTDVKYMNKQLAAMASDLDIQAEIASINNEFSDSGLPLETVFLCFQIRSLDPNRFPADPVGKISDSKMLEVETAVHYCLGL